MSVTRLIRCTPCEVSSVKHLEARVHCHVVGAGYVDSTRAELGPARSAKVDRVDAQPDVGGVLAESLGRRDGFEIDRTHTLGRTIERRPVIKKDGRRLR